MTDLKRGRPVGSGKLWVGKTHTVRVPEGVTGEEIADLMELRDTLIRHCLEEPLYQRGSVHYKVAVMERWLVHDIVMAHTPAETWLDETIVSRLETLESLEGEVGFSL